MKTRTLLPVFFLLLVAATISPAQTQTDSTHHRQNFKFKKTSLQFSLNQYSGLRSFEGGLLSAKYHFSNPFALRLGIDFYLNNSDNSSKIEVVETDSLISIYDRTSKKNTVRILATFIYYFNPSDEFKLFAGTGPFLSLSTRKQNESNRYSDFINYNNKEITTYSAGLRFVYGLEWFFRENMSLLAQYGFQTSYDWSETVTTTWVKAQPGNSTTRKNTLTGDGFSLNSGVPNLGLSLYF